MHLATANGSTYTYPNHSRVLGALRVKQKEEATTIKRKVTSHACMGPETVEKIQKSQTIMKWQSRISCRKHPITTEANTIRDTRSVSQPCKAQISELSNNNFTIPPTKLWEGEKVWLMAWGNFSFLSKVSDGCLIGHFVQAMNSASSNSVTRINLQHHPQVFCTKSVLLHTLIQKSSLYKNGYICIIMF